MILIFSVCLLVTDSSTAESCRDVSLPMETSMPKHECMIQGPQSIANWLVKEKLDEGYYISRWHCEGSPV